MNLLTLSIHVPYCPGVFSQSEINFLDLVCQIFSVEIYICSAFRFKFQELQIDLKSLLSDSC